MELTAYLDLIQDRLAAYFDIEKPFEYQRETLDLYAKSDMRNERYFASKKIKVYAIENKEHVFVKHVQSFSHKALDDFWQMLVKAADELPEPHEEHMSTIINGVLVTQHPVEPEAQKTIQQMKHEKSFMFGLKGWVYIRLVAVDLHEETLVHNKRGKEVKELYSPGKPVKLITSKSVKGGSI